MLIGLKVLGCWTIIMFKMKSKIFEKTYKFILLKRKAVMTKAMELGIDRLGDLNGILDDSMTREKVYEILIKKISRRSPCSKCSMD